MAKKQSKIIKKGGPDQHVRDETLRDFGRRNITIYATEVNLNRAVPDLFDGLKPVQRRILYGASAQKSDAKTARIVGDVLGKFHPHGDKSVSDAIEVMVTSAPVPLMYGIGNWGGLLDGAAAMRYTNCGLTEYGRLMFDPDYIHREVTQFVPNYDGRDEEPVTLPAQMPHVLMTGAEGIGLGISTTLPSFTPESLIEVMSKMLSGVKQTREDIAKTLKPMFRWGGRLVKSKPNQKAWLQMFEDSEATVQFEAHLEVDRPSKSLLIREWPVGLDPQKFVDQVRGLKETKAIYNVEDDITFRIECKPDYNYDQFDRYVEKIQKLTRKNRAFKVNVTRRTAQINDGRVSYKTEMLAMPVPELIAEWLRMRVALELKSLVLRIKKQNAAIDYSKLLIFAANNLDVIRDSLRQDDPDAYLVKKLKITAEQAKTILDLRVRQLSKLDQNAIKAKLAEQQKFLAQLEKWQAKPKRKVLLDLERVQAALAADAKAKLKRDGAELKLA